MSTPTPPGMPPPASAPWTISAGAERVPLTDQRQGETTFTVTNPGPVDARAVLDIEPGGNAQRSWFTVDEPQRPVPHGGSATFLVKLAVPAGAQPGSYWLAGRVYSADTAPEETSVLSDRVTFDVTGAATKQRSKLLWLVPVLVLVLAVAGVAAFLLLRDTGGEAVPTTTTPPPTTVAPAPMPGLIGLTEQEATDTMAEMGITVGTVKYRQDPDNAGKVVNQSVPKDAELADDTSVDLEVAVSLNPATLQAPSNGAKFARDQDLPTVSWQAVPNAASYRVQVESELCAFILVDILPCLYADKDKKVWPSPYADFHIRTFQEATGTSAVLKLELKVHNGVPRAGHSGTVRWQVIPLDDFGNAGPASGYFTFHKSLRIPDEYGPLPK